MDGVEDGSDLVICVPWSASCCTALDMLDSLNAPATKESIAVVQPGGEDCNMP